METEQDYRYQGHKQGCSFSTSKVSAYINSSVEIPKDETGTVSGNNWLFLFLLDLFPFIRAIFLKSITFFCYVAELLCIYLDQLILATALEAAVRLWNVTFGTELCIFCSPYT